MPEIQRIKNLTDNDIEWAVAYKSKVIPGATIYSTCRNLKEARRELEFYRKKDGHPEAVIVYREWEKFDA